ncbi:hypothetical protein BMS3Abin04_01459 [bacterium BMS3Abin04]|nr:hypothetical protein BMS3Abin04_01459 [bacterium BMS3Abin04]
MKNKIENLKLNGISTALKVIAISSVVIKVVKTIDFCCLSSFSVAHHLNIAVGKLKANIPISICPEASIIAKIPYSAVVK